MSQVIEVRLINPANQEVLYDEFIEASSYRHAIELALAAFSGGVGMLKEAQQQAEPTWVIAGAISAWKYIYSITLEAEEESQPDLEAMAVLFTQYKFSE